MIRRNANRHLLAGHRNRAIPTDICVTLGFPQKKLDEEKIAPNFAIFDTKPAINLFRSGNNDRLPNSIWFS